MADRTHIDATGAGAGNVEGPGALDIYNFDAAAGQIAIFDLLAGDNVRLGWRLEAPDGTTLFDSFVGDRQVTLPTTGTYSLTVGGHGIDDSGTYSFQLLEVPPVVEEFSIAFGDTVSDGVPAPGAGNIEVPGAIDRYRFEGAGTSSETVSPKLITKRSGGGASRRRNE
jgi:hypothetical protein